ncbi:retrovirus-related pol polyprotein from transposon TNT 1-94, partial [Tanacetum coccineum]
MLIAPNKPEISHTEDAEGPPDIINTEGTHEQNVQNEQNVQDEQISIQSTEASKSFHPVPQDRWSKYQHIKLVNIIGDPSEGMLTKSMAAKLTAALASEYLFADFLSEIEPKKTLVPLPHGKTAIGSKWIFRNKKDEHGITTKNKARVAAQGYSQEEGIDYDETFAPVVRMEAIRIFLAFATYMNFKVYQIDVKSVFLNGKLKEEVYIKKHFGFESSEFPDYVCKLDKALYGTKQAPRAWFSAGTTPLLMTPLLFTVKKKGKSQTGTKSDPKDSVGNKQPINKGLSSMVFDEGAAKTTPLPKEPRGDKDLKGLKPPADMVPQTNPVADLLGTGAKYQADQTQSARLRYRFLTENKGKTSFEVEPDIKALQIKTFADVQALLLFDDEMIQESDDE